MTGASMNEPALLAVRDLAVTSRTGAEHVRAVRGVDFTLHAGQTLGMAGESGSGKTTVALSLLRLLPASAKVTGQVLFRGEDVLGFGWEKLRAVRWAGASVVFQGAMSALNPVQTIGDQIREPILLHQRAGSREADVRIAPLLREPRHPYAAILPRAFPQTGDPSSRLAPAGLPGEPPDLRTELPGCPFAPRCPEAVIECSTREIELWPSGPQRESACIKVLA